VEAMKVAGTSMIGSLNLIIHTLLCPIIHKLNAPISSIMSSN